MRTSLKLIILLMLLWAPAGTALASFETSEAWFQKLPAAQRVETQTDLILLGFYKHLADGRFGHGTFNALVAFQKSQNRSGSGVLTAFEQKVLRNLATQLKQRFGMERVSDERGHVAITIPGRLLSIRTPTDVGMSYASEDGEISLETMRASLRQHTFRELYESVAKPDAERKIKHDSFSDNRFVVSGTLGDYSFYTMFMSAGAQAVGYSLAWGKGYADEGGMASFWIGSHFKPLSRDDGDAVPELASSFSLPPEQPDAIQLDGDITGATPADFDRAMAARPSARTVILSSDGGRVDSALVVAREIQRRGLQTFIPAGSGCYSACAYIFLAGSNRRAEGELGVHQLSAETDMVTAQSMLGDVLEALQDFGVDRKVVSYMLRTPPDSMHVFSAAELNELGINRGELVRQSVAVASIQVSPTAPLPVAGGAAFVQLASQPTQEEAERSLDYARGRWAELFGGAELEIKFEGDIYLVRLPAKSTEHAAAICTHIKADGGGCYVSGG